MSNSEPKNTLNAGRDINAQDIVEGDKVTINVSTTPDSTAYATRAEYLAQLIDRHQDLEFVGIPELKDRQALRIEEVFIHLQAEIEKELWEIKELAHRQGQQDEDADFLEFSSKFPQKLKRRLSANEALRENKLLVILGDPGAGKTTLLKYITLAFAQNQSDKLGLSEARLPIFVRLYDYVAKRPERSDKGFSLVDYLYVHARENLHLALEPNFFESELERGNCCVCLDGLDELGGAGLRREVTADVAALASRYPHNRFVVTSRRVGYGEAPLDRREFIHHTVLPLSDDDIREFVQKWYIAREKDPTAQRERAEHLTKTIMAEPRIKSLAANPLMLTIIALVHRIEAELPHERVKLYDKCVTALVETWESVKGLTVEDRQRPYYKYRRRLLEQLAYWMHARPELVEGRASTSSAREKSSSREIKEGDLELQLTRFLLDNPKLQLDDEAARQEARDFIALAKARTGLLVERGEGVYVFVHLTFQEYLAACDIERRCDTADKIWQAIQPRLHDPHWREVVLLVLGLQNRYDNRPTELVRRIYESTDEYEDILHRHLFLAARALADRAEVEAKLRNSIVDRLIELACSSEFARHDAFKALGMLQGDNRARESLFALTRDKTVPAEVRRRAAQALGQLGYADDATSILLSLARDETVEVEVRYDAVRAIGKMGRADDAVFSSLLALAYDQEMNKKVRGAAMHTIEQLALATNITLPLFELAQNQRAEVWMRINAAESIGQLGRAADAASILLAITHNKKLDQPERSMAVLVLGDLDYSDNTKRTDLLTIAHDQDVDPLVRTHAAQALGKSGCATDAAPILLALACDKKVDADTQHYAMSTLGALSRTDDLAPFLLSLAQNKTVEPDLRHAAAQALGQLDQAERPASLFGDPTSLSALARDETVDVLMRITAVQAIGQLRPVDDVAPILLTIARDPTVDSRVRSAAAEDLGKLGHAEDAIPILLTLTRDKKVDIRGRSRAASALGELGQAEDAIPILLALARDNTVTAEVRRDAYKSLKALVGGEAESLKR